MDLRDKAAVSVAAGRPVLVHSFDEWRAAARGLLAHQLAPHAVQWISHPGDGDLFSGASLAAAPSTARAQDCPLRIPRKLLDLLQAAACCRVPDRWAFLYRVLWRWQQGQHELLSAFDADGARLHGMVKAVKREEHDMHARIRFRERRADAGPPRFVAWFEPSHDVLPQVARHFARRMGRVTWMIATPEASVMWDGASLRSTGALMRGPDDMNGAGEALWLAYFRGIFHPARLNADLLHGQLPSPCGNKLPGAAAAPAKAGAQDETQHDTPGTLDACRRCDLWKNATQAVGGVGPARAPIMLVGEQPGDQEDRQGLPFVGPAGQLLERAMAQAGLERRAIYLTNAVKHFKWAPRGKRRMHKTPAQREIDACRYWLDSELARVAPKVVVALGSTALKSLTGNPQGTLKDVLGKPFQHQGRWVVAVYHPSYVLRLPGEDNKRQAFEVLVEGLREAGRLRGS